MLRAPRRRGHRAGPRGALVRGGHGGPRRPLRRDAAGRRARSRPTAPSYHAGGLVPRADARAARDGSGPAASTRWARSTARPRGHRPRRDRAAHARPSSSQLDHEYRRSRPRAIRTPRSRRRSPSSATPCRPPPSPALCWGDSRIGNMIFADDGTVAAVLDWEMVTAGDPVQDLGWYLLLDRHHHEAFDVPRQPGLLDRAGSIARWEAGQRPLGRAPRLVRAAGRCPLRGDPHPCDEAPRLDGRAPRDGGDGLRPDRQPAAAPHPRRKAPEPLMLSPARRPPDPPGGRSPSASRAPAIATSTTATTSTATPAPTSCSSSSARASTRTSG